MNPINVEIVPLAVIDFGFSAENTISGVGLNTFGFLWGKADFWNLCPCSDDTVPVWTDDCCEVGEDGWSNDCCEPNSTTWSEDCCE